MLYTVQYFAMNFAAEYGHLKCLKYLYETVGAICTEYAMDYAATNGHVGCLKYLHETVGAKYTMDSAVTNGHFEVSQISS